MGGLIYTTQTTDVDDAKMYIKNDGNVGIGTTSPTTGYKLHVNGQIKCSDQFLVDSGNSYDYFTGMASDTTVFQGKNGTELRANSGDIAFYASSLSDSNERMRIKMMDLSVLGLLVLKIN